MRFAYADPPYLGCCSYYGHRHEEPYGCWNDLGSYRILLLELQDGYDGWALSCSSPSLRDLLPLTPPKTRVAAWVKPYASLKPGVRPGYAWEPVLFAGGRKTGFPPPERYGGLTTPRDWLSVRITQERGLAGAKPAEFCRWVLDMLGYMEGDTVNDLFPGTAVMDAVLRQGTLDLAGEAS
jgi:hypothetical protein